MANICRRTGRFRFPLFLILLSPVPKITLWTVTLSVGTVSPPNEIGSCLKSQNGYLKIWNLSWLGADGIFLSLVVSATMSLITPHNARGGDWRKQSMALPV
ncbi:hypothetical protein [Paraburkholderia kirstenboschensis]|uniref:Uncharacterized protein n=1 Tax=Paraburkholderia kirstenboschensis TaxID=1245436 RepID=A0ABZ0EF86_9BURK|nr:hypothetical protein [Paraburkholderia kirstenboschensis]WOD15886.1 hypothetical protein RW095_21900 [Paraburkholderia kirstenboschensis]